MSHFPSQAQRLLVYILFILTGQMLYSQRLSYCQGQVLVQFKPQVQVNDFHNKLKARGSGQTQFDRIEAVVPEWNIFLLHFDFAKYSEIKTITELSKNTEVLFAQHNHLIHSRRKPNDPLFNRQWHHFNDGAGGNPDADLDTDMAWEITTGGLTEEGDTIVLCVIDDGLERTHPDMIENMWVNHNEIPQNGKDDDLNGYIDDYLGWNSFQKTDQFSSAAHGTAVCGLAAAKGNNGMGITGINWNVKLMFVAGGGTESNAIQSYFYPLRQRQMYNSSQGNKGAYVVCVNSSWGSDFGRPEDAPIWCAIYDSLGQAGILAAAATTNQNINVDIEGDLPTTCGSDYIVAVTNINIENTKDMDAGFGPVSIDIGAYGEDVYSLYTSNSYRNFKGTSGAAPQVAGAIALIYSAPCNNLVRLSKINPAAAALEAKQIILEYAKPNASLFQITTSGAVLNVGNSVASITPLQLYKIGPNTLSFAMEGSLILPAKIEWRLKGSSSIKDTTIFSTNPFTIGNLETCEEYEVRYKGLCERFSNGFSPWRNYKTNGCCNAPEKIRIVQMKERSAMVMYQNTAQAAALGATIRLQGTSNWDTLHFDGTQNILEINNLVPCSSYEIRLWSFCNGKPSPESPSSYFQTKGCQFCTELDYCKRLKPQSNLEWIESVGINGITYQSKNDGGFGNYVGFNQQWVLQKGKVHMLNIRPGYGADSSKVLASCWIDYDQDGFFSDQENIINSKEKFSREKNYSFSVSPACKVGFTRMRVIMKFAEFSDDPPLACFQSIEFGEYEDYCVYIASELCSESWSVQPVFTTKSEALFDLHKPNGFTLEYAYRKPHQSLWITGSTNNTTLNITQLDSCSTYEFQFRAACRPSNVNQIKTEFKTVRTTGNPCISNTTILNELLGITFYPTICNDILYCKNDKENDNITYNILNIQSKVIKIGKLQSHLTAIDVQQLPAGLYLVQCHSGRQQAIHKFVKQ